MTMSDTTLKIKMDLQYDHSFGELSPYFEGLSNGRAMARRCKDCGRVWFPPHTLCPEDGGFCDWLELEGNGLVTSVTETRSLMPFAQTYADNIFLMVAMAGADNAVFGKLCSSGGVAVCGTPVRLIEVPQGSDYVLQAATFEVFEEER